jgi:hypothetical protein
VIPDLHLESLSPMSSITAFIEMKNKLLVHPYLSKEFDPFNDSFMVKCVSCISEYRRVEDISWRLMQGHIKGSLGGCNFFIAGDYYALFMMFTIHDEVRGVVKGLRVLDCKRERKHRLWIRS